MGSMKEHMMDLQEERFEAWAELHRPDIKPSSSEWEIIREEYYDWQDFLYEQGQAEYEKELYSASLNSVRDRCKHAFSELDRLSDLNASSQPPIVLRMSWVHAVSVMEACVMYSARALLNHEPHLNLFRLNHAKIGLRRDHIKLLDTAARLEASGEPDASKDAYRLAAQSIVGSRTFHNPEYIRRYFGCMLQTVPAWPTDSLSDIIETRHDLVHRNGNTAADTEAVIGRFELLNALKTIIHFLELFSETMASETAGYTKRDDDEF
ncbi:MAG: hypothetical protein FT726_26275 [Pantoea sp. Morm]|uniref:hypothetical protein n=1 Tax=Pantoea sp. Morm TaxID=2601250 RepID=UPI001DC8BDB8|nr:hypothetical protein [Pantoea sp. Morm]